MARPWRGRCADAGLRADTIVIEPGECAKSFAGLESLCTRLLALGLERGDLVIAFGGGVVGDLAGFAAAIYKRGIDFAQIPTTLLAQVDSSVGGKTAIDTPAGQEHDRRLPSAPARPGRPLRPRHPCPIASCRAGWPRCSNTACWATRASSIGSKARTPDLLRRDPDALSHAVRRSVEMKAAIVAEDEREGGARALLNLGHTFGHAVEAETGFGDA